MSLSLPLLFLVIMIVLLGGAVAWYFTDSSRAIKRRHEELRARRQAQQPWDAQSADGRGNR